MCIRDSSYTEVTQKSVPPTMSMMSVPRELRDDIKMIDANGSFTVGLSNAGKVYVWGATQIGTTGVNVANIPDEVKNTKIAMVAAGIDHIVAIGENGKVYALSLIHIYVLPSGQTRKPKLNTIREQTANEHRRKFG